MSQLVFLMAVYGAAMAVKDTSLFIVASIACLLSVLSIILLFKTMRDIIRSNNLKSSLDNLRQQQDLQFEHYNALIVQINQTDKIRHDISNQLSVISTILEQCEYAKAVELLHGMHQNFRESSPDFFCSNPTVNAVLYNKKNYASSLGIELLVCINVSNDIGINDLDLMSLFVNLLDNAIEGSVRAKKETISPVKVCDDMRAGFYTIILENDKLEMDSFKNNLPPPTQKQDAIQHGFGGQIIAEIISKYDGTLVYNDLGDKLKTVASLRVYT